MREHKRAVRYVMARRGVGVQWRAPEPCAAVFGGVPGSRARRVRTAGARAQPESAQDRGEQRECRAARKASRYTFILCDAAGPAPAVAGAGARAR